MTKMIQLLKEMCQSRRDTMNIVNNNEINGSRGSKKI